MRHQLGWLGMYGEPSIRVAISMMDWRVSCQLILPDMAHAGLARAMSLLPAGDRLWILFTMATGPSFSVIAIESHAASSVNGYGEWRLGGPEPHPIIVRWSVLC